MTEHGSADDAKGVQLSLVAYIVLAVILIVSYQLTDVLVLLAQATDRVGDVLISLFFLASIYLSRRPADSTYAYGHARAQNVAVLIVATILIFFLSLGLIQEALPRLADPSSVDASDQNIALGVTMLSMIVIAVPTVVLLRGHRGGSSRAQLINLLLDEFASAVSLVAIVLIGFGYELADPVGSLVVAGALLITGAMMLRENATILIGKSPDAEYMGRMESAARSVPGVMGVHKLRAEYVGPDTIHADLHLELDPDMPIKEADRIAHEVERRLAEETGCRYCEVHAGPYGPH